MCAFLSALKIGVSASYFNKKCTGFGSTFNDKLLADKEELLAEKEEQALKKHYYEDLGNGDFGPGWKVAFDNFDVYQRVRDMTEDNQTRDIHWVKHTHARFLPQKGCHYSLFHPKGIIRWLTNFEK